MVAEVAFIRRHRQKEGEAQERSYAPGDVILVKGGAWKWGSLDLTNPNWRIVRFTRCDPDDLGVLLRPEVFSDVVGGALARRRAYRFDVERMPAAFRQWWEDDSRFTPILEVTMARAAVLAMLVHKTPRQGRQRVL